MLSFFLSSVPFTSGSRRVNGRLSDVVCGGFPDIAAPFGPYGKSISSVKPVGRRPITSTPSTWEDRWASSSSSCGSPSRRGYYQSFRLDDFEDALVEAFHAIDVRSGEIERVAAKAAGNIYGSKDYANRLDRQLAVGASALAFSVIKERVLGAAHEVIRLLAMRQHELEPASPSALPFASPSNIDGLVPGDTLPRSVGVKADSGAVDAGPSPLAMDAFLAAWRSRPRLSPFRRVRRIAGVGQRSSSRTARGSSGQVTGEALKRAEAAKAAKRAARLPCVARSARMRFSNLVCS